MSHDRVPPSPHAGLTRREFLSLAGAAAVTTPLLGGAEPAAAAAQPGHTPKPQRRAGKAPNILFVFTDQERHITQWPKGYTLPGHEQLAKRGVRFDQHYCPAVMCTSSRAVLMTGLQTADNRMFENADMPYVAALSTKLPTVGHMLRKAGYYTAYKGKWHLNAAFDTESPDRLFTKEMDAYGFSDFVWPGDVLVHTLGGYHHDHMIAGSAVSWMREKGQALQQEGKPWALFVSLVNPHDIMYFNTDAPGEQVQDTGHLLMHAARAPEHPAYRTRWNAPLPASLHQPLDAPGRPGAHREFHRAWGYTLGTIPPEAERWQRFSDFYLNSIRSVDAQLKRMLDELDALGLSDDTIIVFTSDHGEMGGAHGLRGKGPFAYQEAIHLPMYVAHPDVRGGQTCKALTGHIDIVPTLLSLAGIDATHASELAGRQLPGRDFSPALAKPASAAVHAVRDAVLFTYSGIATNDSEVTRIVSEARAAGQDPKGAMAAAGYRPNLRKRGSLRAAFDGRYKLTRYFAPVERHRPANLDELFARNDVELFDLHTDPHEMHNLALDRAKHAGVLETMREKLEQQIQREIGVDDGREMPDFDGIQWQIDRLDL
ncbi:sulfatase-like hydrolase/transferase [Niveibacterium microcysteis]|uniref:Sulfatase-like hydrolase/transferase n=1 Tax=Niveibacterium microcysteis TaxID=2811415 RepID=A0ABX7M4E9_9RHOO|nr:sulfatase-like hydrolase/transferase [Niveibacterium microcysteis]QSI76319.1 sulfatase-like hydrolase/transferase [Niveibacterium microcysteis]